MKLNIKTQFKR